MRDLIPADKVRAAAGSYIAASDRPESREKWVEVITKDAADIGYEVTAEETDAIIEMLAENGLVTGDEVHRHGEGM